MDINFLYLWNHMQEIQLWMLLRSDTFFRRSAIVWPCWQAASYTCHKPRQVSSTTAVPGAVFPHCATVKTYYTSIDRSCTPTWQHGTLTVTTASLHETQLELSNWMSTSGKLLTVHDRKVLSLCDQNPMNPQSKMRKKSTLLFCNWVVFKCILTLITATQMSLDHFRGCY